MIWTYGCGFKLLPLQVTLKPVDEFSWNCVHAVEFTPPLPLPLPLPSPLLPHVPYSWRTDYKFCVMTSSKNMQFFLGAITKLRKATISFVMSVRPHATTRFPLHGLSWNFYIWRFFDNLSIQFKFHYNLKRITGTLHEDFYVYYDNT